VKVHFDSADLQLKLGSDYFVRCTIADRSLRRFAHAWPPSPDHRDCVVRRDRTVVRRDLVQDFAKSVLEMSFDRKCSLPVDDPPNIRGVISLRNDKEPSFGVLTRPSAVVLSSCHRCQLLFQPIEEHHPRSLLSSIFIGLFERSRAPSTDISSILRPVDRLRAPLTWLSRWAKNQQHYGDSTHAIATCLCCNSPAGSDQP
jgi:hypothetical protein